MRAAWRTAPRPPSRLRDCHSAAPPSSFVRCFNRDGEGMSAKWTERSETALYSRLAVSPLSSLLSRIPPLSLLSCSSPLFCPPLSLYSPLPLSHTAAKGTRGQLVVGVCCAGLSPLRAPAGDGGVAAAPVALLTPHHTLAQQLSHLSFQHSLPAILLSAAPFSARKTSCATTEMTCDGTIYIQRDDIQVD